ncbi:MAG: hypothetical protein JNM34_08765 [Chthonomonadaceae bacterium]|nr:hypothetical protein [Chthonomonadaceae bacterium]
MLLALSLIGYVASAATFYLLAAREAVEVEDTTGTLPQKLTLTVVEGGAGTADDLHRAA